MTHLITFADNNAVGYFQKQARAAQTHASLPARPGHSRRMRPSLLLPHLIVRSRASQGFSKEILMEREKWAGYIKARTAPRHTDALQHAVMPPPTPLR